MDQRETFNSAEQLFGIVSTNFQAKKPASLLIDNGGLQRIEGTITAIEKNVDLNKTNLTVAGNYKFLLEQIIGINGVFRSDYSEC